MYKTRLFLISVKMKYKITFIAIQLLPAISVFSQDSSAVAKRATLTFSGYADIYYQYDFNKPADKLRPPFLYNFKKHNEINPNLVLLKAAYEGEKIRANLGVMTGNYAKFNLAAEPEFFRHIYEVNAGYKFSNKISCSQWPRAWSTACTKNSALSRRSRRDCWPCTRVSRRRLRWNSPAA